MLRFVAVEWRIMRLSEPQERTVQRILMRYERQALRNPVDPVDHTSDDSSGGILEGFGRKR